MAMTELPQFRKYVKLQEAPNMTEAKLRIKMSQVARASSPHVCAINSCRSGAPPMRPSQLRPSTLCDAGWLVQRAARRVLRRGAGPRFTPQPLLADARRGACRTEYGAAHPFCFGGRMRRPRYAGRLCRILRPQVVGRAGGALAGQARKVVYLLAGMTTGVRVRTWRTKRRTRERTSRPWRRRMMTARSARRPGCEGQGASKALERWRGWVAKVAWRLARISVQGGVPCAKQRTRTYIVACEGSRARAWLALCAVCRPGS